MLAFSAPHDALRGRISAPWGSVVVIALAVRIEFILHLAKFVNVVVEFVGGEFVGDRFVADDAFAVRHA